MDLDSRERLREHLSLFFGAPGRGALARECKTPMTPAGGIMSRTARVSTARWNLKEAGGETLA